MRLDIDLAVSLTQVAEDGTPAAPVNAALSTLVGLEARALRHLDMPVGSSLLALARNQKVDLRQLSILQLELSLTHVFDRPVHGREFFEEVIRENLERAGLADRARVVRGDVARAIGTLDGPFDLAFLDPPYASPADELAETLGRLTALAPGGTIVLTRPRSSSTDVIPIHWGAVKVLDYGDTRVLICREGT